MSQYIRIDKKKRKKVVNDLRQRFEAGEKISVREIVIDYLKPTTLEDTFIAPRIARTIIAEFCKEYTILGRTFGRLDEVGNYGFAENETEARYLGVRRFNLSNGHVKSTFLIISNAKKEKLINKGDIEEHPTLLLKPRTENHA